LSIPCLVAFLLIPDLIMRALFVRGAFTASDASAAGQTLSAYAVGLLPFVLIRSVTATFFARGDTATPVKASLTAVAVNVLLKIVLMRPFAQVGLALATSIGAWLNLGLVTWFAARRGHFAFDSGLRKSIAGLMGAGCVLTLALGLAHAGFTRLWPLGTPPADLLALLGLGIIGALVYGTALLAFFGRDLRKRYR
jgi:putative peptidoglycan lipid II flippase